MDALRAFPWALFNASYAWAVACSAMHVLCMPLLTPRFVPRLARLSPRERGVLCNTAVAATHAAVMFAGTAAYMWPRLDTSHPLLFDVRRVTPNSETENFYCCLMIGYLLYDFAAGALTGANGSDIVAHHALGLASWGSLRLSNCGGFYMMWVHLAEVRPCACGSCKPQRHGTAISSG